MALRRVQLRSNLEVGVGEDRSGRAKVFDFGEARHELGPGDAALLVDELDGRALAVVGHAVAHQHVELVVVVLNGQHHRHRLADLDQTRHLAGPRALANLRSVSSVSAPCPTCLDAESLDVPESASSSRRCRRQSRRGRRRACRRGTAGT